LGEGLEGNLDDSLGSRSQKKWVMMRNNKSSLPGLRKRAS